MKYLNIQIGKIFFIFLIIICSIVIESQTKRNLLLYKTPGFIPQIFSVPHGFYETSFSVTVGPDESGSIVKYTLDGSDPQTSGTAILKDSPASILIDPESSEGGRAKSPGVVLRVCIIFSPDSISRTYTQTYLFINKISSLSPDGVKPGPGWPAPTKSGNPQAIDYGMDPEVVNDPRYKDLIDDAMFAVPSISISTDLKNLFDPNYGIYMNALSSGYDWERPASVELLNPDGSEGFQINAGIRIRGGWSAHGDDPKHAFRLFFRKEYGEGKLHYQLFDKEGVDEFDKVDLRTSQNYSWSYPGHQGQYNIMNRDVFSRDLQGKLGEPYTRSRYYHLFIDGVYWGLFQSQERAEADYAASYFGGNVFDYDVIKPNGDTHAVEATDGNLTAYKEIWNLCSAGFGNNTNYFRLQGLNPDETRNPDFKDLVDIDNLIDYMLIIFYAGNFDSPTSKFGSDQSPNNFFCIYNRVKDDGFKFFIHDAEHTLRTTAGEGPGIGLYENRVTLPNMRVSSFSGFHPQWLHFKLTQNAEYRIRFADHVYKHMFNNGWMTPQKAAELFLSRANEIDTAIIAESARWGDTYLNPIGTKALWQSAINDIVNNYFPKRTSIVLDQLKDAGLYPEIDPPIFKSNDIEILSNTLGIQPGFILKIQKTGNENGNIKYTLDGSDPRLTGGIESGSANDGGNEIELTINKTTVIKTRILNGNTWSALHEISLFTGDEKGNVKITEINYHPLDNDSVSDNEYEFIELKNIGTFPVILSGSSFVKGIDYTFPAGTILEPEKFIVLASNPQEFNQRYGFLPFDKYSGQLDNIGEKISLVDAADDTIVSVIYSDKLPWPESADGMGFSLVPRDVNPTGDMNDPDNWRASYEINGSPGKDDLPSTSIDSHSEMPARFKLFQNYPNPFNPNTAIYYSLKEKDRIRLSVYDILGREVAVLVNGVQNAGMHQVLFSSGKLPSGVYFYRLEGERETAVKKMLIMK